MTQCFHSFICFHPRSSAPAIRHPREIGYPFRYLLSPRAPFPVQMNPNLLCPSGKDRHTSCSNVPSRACNVGSQFPLSQQINFFWHYVFSFFALCPTNRRAANSATFLIEFDSPFFFVLPNCALEFGPCAGCKLLLAD
jgi:hypothetical protein